MKFEAWTAKAVEHRILEAQETLMLMPNVKGPQQYGNAMPAPVRDWHQYGMEPSRYKRRPSRDAIGRMEPTWDWINRFLSLSDRRLIYAWAYFKCRRGRTINDFASQEGMNSRTLRRTVTRICQLIANELNQKHSVRLTTAVDDVSEIQHESDPTQVSSVKYANHWMAPGAKPQGLPDLHEQRQPVQREG